LKDTFIGLVIEGPFPHAMSGHVGRRAGVDNRVVAARVSNPRPRSARQRNRKRRKL
jgi:hypothetical protein